MCMCVHACACGASVRMDALVQGCSHARMHMRTRPHVHARMYIHACMHAYAYFGNECLNE